MDIFSPEKRSEIMRKIKGKNTKPELLLRRHLYALGLRYRLNVKTVIGKPDIVFKKYKTVIFVDGDWWHGRHYERDSYKYTPFWRQKIKRNMERDLQVTKELKDSGYEVIRIWQKDLEKQPGRYAEEVKDYIDSIKNGL